MIFEQVFEFVILSSQFSDFDYFLIELILYLLVLDLEEVQLFLNLVYFRIKITVHFTDLKLLALGLVDRFDR